MAFPTIPTVAAGRVLTSLGTTCASGQTFPNLSSLTKNAGDLLIAIVGIYDGNSTNAEFSSWGGGFTEFGDFSTTTTSAIGCAYKWSTGSETGTFTVTSADTSTNDYWTILMSIPGAHPTTPPEAGGYATFTGANVDPGLLNPAGWGTEDTLWIAVGSCNETSLTGSYTGVASAPANYTDYVGTGMSADAIGAVSAAVAFRQLNAASEDPGAFTCDTSNVREAGITIAVRPAPAVHATSGTLAGQGSTVAGTAAHIAKHATTGALTGQGSTVAGTSARTRQHPTTGVLAGQGAIIVGAAERVGGVISHATTGALTGQGATLDGAAARERLHASSGVLAGQGAVIDGAAARTRAHPTSGDLPGGSAAIVGASAISTGPVTHGTSGALSAGSAIIAGAALRSVAHGTSGALVAVGADVSGGAARSSIYPDPADVLAGVIYGPGGIYTGTLDANGLRVELETGRVFKPLTPKIGVLL